MYCVLYGISCLTKHSPSFWSAHRCPTSFSPSLLLAFPPTRLPSFSPSLLPGPRPLATAVCCLMGVDMVRHGRGTRQGAWLVQAARHGFTCRHHVLLMCCYAWFHVPSSCHVLERVCRESWCDVNRWLLVGRITGGIATSILYSCFESWLVANHNLKHFPRSTHTYMVYTYVANHNLNT
jgi:hypothetical protein